MSRNKIYQVSIHHKVKTKGEDLGSTPFPPLWGDAKEEALRVCGRGGMSAVSSCPSGPAKSGWNHGFLPRGKCKLTALMSEREMTWKLGSFDLRKESAFIIFWKFTPYKLYLFSLYRSASAFCLRGGKSLLQRAEIEPVFRTPFTKPRAGNEGLQQFRQRDSNVGSWEERGQHVMVRVDYFNKRVERMREIKHIFSGWAQVSCRLCAYRAWKTVFH